MRKKRKRREALQRIAKLNPQVDKKIVEESLAFVDFTRDIGLKGRGYNLLRSSESKLEIKYPILSKL